MIKKPFFSVIIPVYNKEKHLLRAVESVLNQSWQEFEVLLVCDPSTDSSTQIAKQYESDRVRVFYRDAPGPGGYAARNLGIKHAKGEWLTFLDADDEWDVDYLKTVQYLACEYPEVSVIGSAWNGVNGSRKMVDKYYRCHHHLGPHLVSFTKYLKEGLHGKRPIHTSVACVKSNSPVAKDLFIIHPEVKRGGDLFAWLKLMSFHKTMLWSEQVGANYYVDAENMVTKSAPSTGYLMTRQQLDLLSDGLDEIDRKYLIRYFNRWLRNDWKSNIHRGTDNFSLASRLYWKEDFLYALVVYITTVWPQNLRRLFGFSGKKER